jgi:hypothetical protein
MKLFLFNSSIRLEVIINQTGVMHVLLFDLLCSGGNIIRKFPYNIGRFNSAKFYFEGLVYMKTANYKLRLEIVANDPLH